MFKRFAHFIGWTTDYHIAYLIPQDGGVGYGDTTIRVRPWISADTWRVSRDSIAKDNDVLPGYITILSVTRL